MGIWAQLKSATWWVPEYRERTVTKTSHNGAPKTKLKSHLNSSTFLVEKPLKYLKLWIQTTLTQRSTPLCKSQMGMDLLFRRLQRVSFQKLETLKWWASSKLTICHAKCMRKVKLWIRVGNHSRLWRQISLAWIWVTSNSDRSWTVWCHSSNSWTQI